MESSLAIHRILATVKILGMRQSAVSLFLLGFLFTVQGRTVLANTSDLFINEILVSNASTNLDPDNYNFVDWIEVYNAGSQSVNLGGYYLTDDLTAPTKWKIPGGTTIDPGKFLLFWADNTDKGRHTNFQLSQDGEDVGLFSPTQVLIDSVIYGSQTPDVSFGRQPDGSSDWFYFSQPTSGSSNNKLALPNQATAPTPQFSLPGGFYGSSQTVALTVTSPTAEIRYTLDGSIPTATSKKYASPISVNSTKVIRARAFETGFLPSPMVAHTYFINDTPTLPVVSIATDPANLWDDVIGIHVEGTNGITGKCVTTPVNWNQDWERPANVEFYEPTGDLGFNSGVGLKIFGNCSRRFDLKSFSIHARDKYGAPAIGYQIFKDKPISTYTSFILRNSGLDWDQTLYRDGMQQSLVKDQMDIDYQAYRAVVVFTNGEFWGILNLREKLNEDYILYNYGYDRDNVDFIKNKDQILAGDMDNYNAMVDFIDTNDMAVPANYAYVQTLMDVSQFMNYELAEIYIDNGDWPGNNVRRWRPRTADGIWRWVIYDTDWGFGLRNGYTHNALEAATTPDGTGHPNPPWSTLILRNLLDNPDFRDDFIQRFASHINITFEPNRVIDIIDSMKADLDPEMPRHFAKWGTPPFWDKRVDVMREFARERPAYQRDHIKQQFGLKGMVDVTINIVGPDMGKVLINTVVVPHTNFTGPYFKNVPLQIEAIPNPGYRFVGWQEVTAGPSFSINLTNDITLTAVFEVSPIVINEIHYNPADAQGADDDYEFIELYNPSPLPVDLSGYSFTDGIVFTFPTNSTIGPGEFIVIAKNAATYSGSGYQVFQWTSGNLANSGENIEFQDLNGSVIDVVNYSDSSPWPVEPDGGGPSLSLISYTLDNALPTSWVGSAATGCTPGQPNNSTSPSCQVQAGQGQVYLPIVTKGS